MVVLYYIAVKCYGLAILTAAIFHAKARLWVTGRIRWRQQIKSSLIPGESRILFHCASLGEFEQGKPVLEALKQNYPTHKIVLTFFSPSGYEVRKKDPLADYVFYLPLDGPWNARDFIDLVNPTMVFFVKYDFWHFFIKEFKTRKIPIYFVSSIFRPTQIFFQPLMTFFDKMLRRVTHFFVQNQSSLELLYNRGIPQVSVTGDTRFDRVYQNCMQLNAVPEIENFKESKKLLVAGSTWPNDEKLLIRLFDSIRNECKMIVVPHEITEYRIQQMLKKFGGNVVRYSTWDKKDFTPEILIIDNVGMLSAIYKSGDFAYVGGGFGKGIHNILEAAVFGIPVFFGPKFKKFREANDLLHWKSAISIRNETELINRFAEIMNDEKRLLKIKDINERYINNNKGSTELIISFLKVNQ